MSNPWNQIKLDDYENHMKQNSVRQLQAMNRMMYGQIYRYPVSSIMILGIAGGNGLNHIHAERIKKVYGVDINETYLAACLERYAKLGDIFQPIKADLTDPKTVLPEADIVIANLLVEYVGYACFQQILQKTAPKFVSCIIQINTGGSFVSDSTYLKVFYRLSEVHHQMDENALTNAMKKIGYLITYTADEDLPNGKKLVRLDYKKQTNAY